MMIGFCIQSTCKGSLANNYSTTLVEDAQDSIIKSMRRIWNKKFRLKTITTKEYLKIRRAWKTDKFRNFISIDSEKASLMVALSAGIMRY